MRTLHRMSLTFVASVASVSLVSCQPKAQAATTPVDEAASLAPCQAKLQATQAYVSFAEPPHEAVFFLGPHATEEIIASFRTTACDPRPDLPEHAMLADALTKGALMLATITFIGDLPNAAEVVVNEAKYGDATAPDARSFALRVHRAQPLTMADTQPGAQLAVQSWRITAVSLRR